MAAVDMTREECIAVLAGVSIGRVAITHAALPAVVPVNFALYRDSILFGVMSESRLAAATERSVVAFQADSFDLSEKSGWSVMVIGPSSWVSDSLDLETAKALLPEPWANGHTIERVVQITMARVNGLRVYPTTGSPLDEPGP